MGASSHSRPIGCDECHWVFFANCMADICNKPLLMRFVSAPVSTKAQKVHVSWPTPLACTYTNNCLCFPRRVTLSNCVCGTSRHKRGGTSIRVEVPFTCFVGWVLPCLSFLDEASIKSLINNSRIRYLSAGPKFWCLLDKAILCFAALAPSRRRRRFLQLLPSQTRGCIPRMVFASPQIRVGFW